MFLLASRMLNKHVNYVDANTPSIVIYTIIMFLQLHGRPHMP